MKRTLLILMCSTALQVTSTALALSARACPEGGVTEKTTNTALGTSELIEQNQKEVNDIYLGTVAKDIETFTAVEANTLYAIASQCPMVGGNAVYRARALYSLVDDEEEFDDPAICLQQGIVVRSADEDGGSAVQVLPNPASEEATLIYQLDEGATGELIIRDAMGRVIVRHTVGSEQNRFAFSTTQLAAGLYHFVLIVDDEQVGDGKLTIVR